MLQQLTNLSDKELISRARKINDQEAEGVLLERYGHLIVAVCLPYLDKGPDSTPEDLFPTILQKLSNSLKTQTIHKTNEWIHYTIRNRDKNAAFFPTLESREQQQVESKVEKAASNAKEQQLLAEALEKTMQQLSEPERTILQQFYIEQKTFAQLAAEKKLTIEKTRQLLKTAKQKLAGLLVNSNL
jgi:RNA polymerase sigma factor (sigma-70 family)